MSLFSRFFQKTEVDQARELTAEVAVGDAFRTWIQSDVGRYIAGRAEQHELAVLRELAGCDPEDTVKLMRLQAEAKIPGRILQWIEEAMGAGETARFQLAEMEGE